MVVILAEHVCWENFMSKGSNSQTIRVKPKKCELTSKHFKGIEYAMCVISDDRPGMLSCIPKYLICHAKPQHK